MMNFFLVPEPCSIDGRATGKIFEVKMVVKMKLKVTTALIASLFLISAIAMVTPVKAADPNRILMIDIMAKGDDLDISGATNSISAKIEFDKVSGNPLVQLEFNYKIYDESGQKVYAMKGMLKDGLLLTTDHYFYCPVFNVWFINVWWVMGEGKFKTTDTDFEVFFRRLVTITMPNTEGKYESAQILMWLSPTAEYCLEDPGKYPPGPDKNPVYKYPEGWVLAAVIWDVTDPPIGPIPIGPISYLTKYMEKWVP